MEHQTERVWRYMLDREIEAPDRFQVGRGAARGHVTAARLGVGINMVLSATCKVVAGVLFELGARAWSGRGQRADSKAALL
jgi:hypothetical protein